MFSRYQAEMRIYELMKEWLAIERDLNDWVPDVHNHTRDEALMLQFEIEGAMNKLQEAVPIRYINACIFNFGD